jgi:GTP cyclohydrolase I
MESNLAENMLSFPTALSPEAEQVRLALTERGLETPLIHNGLSRDEKYQRISRAFAEITPRTALPKCTWMKSSRGWTIPGSPKSP